MLKILDETNLHLLQNFTEPKSVSMVAEETQMSKSTINRNAKILCDNSLIQKDNGCYSLTKVGKIIIQKFSVFENIQKYQNYFLNHTLSDIPENLISSIEELGKFEITQSIWPTTTRLKEILDGAKDFVDCIFTQPPFLLADLAYEKIQSGVKMRFLFGRNSDVPECNDLVDKLKLDKPTISEKFEKRICQRVITNVVVSDFGGAIMLADNENNTDMSMAIIGYDRSFIRWCQNFFELKWEQGEIFARLR